MICAWIDMSSAETGSSRISALRLAGQRAGDADPLALAARERVRVAVEVLRRAARPASIRERAVVFERPPADAAERERLGERLADRAARVQRRVRVLEQVLHRGPDPFEVLARPSRSRPARRRGSTRRRSG